MKPRLLHKAEVLAFVAHNFPSRPWTLSLPHGSGQETYFAHSSGQALFIKLGAYAERAIAMSEVGITPPVLSHGTLDDGSSILAQQLIEGRTPTRKDFQAQLDQCARVVGTMHRSEKVRVALPPAPSEQYGDAARSALAMLRLRWENVQALVLSKDAVKLVEAGLERIEGQIDRFSGAGLVASHNDICNANWLLTPEGKLYLVDLEMMSLEDPACDLGAILWWYYPPDERARFLEIAGYYDNPNLRTRMRVRMAMHCLSITLPRQGSYDRFDASSYGSRLVDFQAALEGRENPQGYE